jgi:hypothetical protein
MTGVRQCKKGEGVSSQNVLAKRPPHPFFAAEDLQNFAQPRNSNTSSRQTRKTIQSLPDIHICPT